MTRVALYARFSSDRQDCLSIDDQLALCRDHGAARGWMVVAEHVDRALSGAHAGSRPALLALLAAAAGP